MHHRAIEKPNTGLLFVTPGGEKQAARSPLSKQKPPVLLAAGKAKSQELEAKS
jgi:hypothetical protein